MRDKNLFQFIEPRQIVLILDISDVLHDLMLQKIRTCLNDSWYLLTHRDIIKDEERKLIISVHRYVTFNTNKRQELNKR